MIKLFKKHKERYKMRDMLISTLLISITMKCPLCKETFRNKFNVRKHLHKEHTESEAEKYLMKIL
tara:strand:- start:711 stop:905 length:195 start_codon:yes stop_codon:yes gene_type:complete